MIQTTLARKGPKSLEEVDHFTNFIDIPQIHSLKAVILKDRMGPETNEHQNIYNYTVAFSDGLNMTFNAGIPVTKYITLEGNVLLNMKSISASYYNNTFPIFELDIYNSNNNIYRSFNLNRNNITEVNLNNVKLGVYKIITLFNTGTKEDDPLLPDPEQSSMSFYWKLSGNVSLKKYYRNYWFSFRHQTKIELQPLRFKGQIKVFTNNFSTVLYNIQSSNYAQPVIINHDFGFEYTDCVIQIWNQYAFSSNESPSIDPNNIENDFNIIIYSEDDIHTQENIEDIIDLNQEENVKLAHIHCQDCNFWWIQNKESLQEYIKLNKLQCPECNKYNINSSFIDDHARYVIDDPNSKIDDFYRVLRIVYDQYDTENPIIIIPIQVNFDADKLTGMAPLTVQFINKSNQIFNTFLWNFGDPASGINNESTEENPIHTFNNIGDYDISLSANSIDESDSKLVYDFIRITAVIPAPIAGIFASSLNGIKPFILRVGSTSVGAINSWNWDFGDERTSNLEQPPNIIYNFSGTYIVSLTVNGPGGSDTTSVSINVLSPAQPIADFDIENEPNGFIPYSISFINQSIGTIDSHHWIFGDGFSSDEENPIHIYETPGTFSVSLTTVGPGGIDIITKEDYITILSN